MKTILLAFAIVFVYTLQISAQVDTDWVRTYGSPYGRDDWAWAISVDRFGNVYVTGHSAGSGESQEYATIKYYPNGDTAWIRRYCGLRQERAGANDLAIDDSGNVFVTGFSPGAGFCCDFTTIKYNLNGDTAWVRRYNRTGYGCDGGMAVSVDDSHNVYVTGYSLKERAMYNYATIKYHPNGDTVWVRRYGGPSDLYSVPYALTIDHDGNVYVTGTSLSSITGYDYATVKYYSNGDTAWVRRYSGEGSFEDRATDLFVDDSEYVYVTGCSYLSASNCDYATIKYRADGDTIWVRRYNGTGNYVDSARAIVVDKEGNVYVTGASYGNGTQQDCLTIKYCQDGKVDWVRRYNGPGNSKDIANDIAIDGAGNVYVTGYSMGDKQDYDLVTIKYSSKGQEFCVRRYVGSTGSFGLDDYSAIAVDDSDNVYVAGGNGYMPDYVTIKYLPFISAGDVNSDASVTVSDLVYLINYLFKESPPPQPMASGDINKDGQINTGDIVFLINYLFKGGPSPVC